MVEIKKIIALMSAVPIVAFYGCAPLFKKGPTLEERMSQSLASQKSPNCFYYEFDGLCAQRRVNNICVSYYVYNGYEVISIYQKGIYEKGILTTIPNDPQIEIERFEVSFFKKGLSPCKDLYDPIREIEISPEEKGSIRELFPYYKNLLLNQ